MRTYGEVYLIKNKLYNKCYIGQAKKKVGQVQLTWGTNGRWKSHIREANNTLTKGTKDHCVLLNQAIRKYGVDVFQVTKLCDCSSQDDMDLSERRFIRDYDSKVPKGYNLTDGGGKGQDSDETREKKRQMRLGKEHSNEVKRKISKGQIGNRRTTKKRKYPEDENLPKYICASRKNGKICGYAVRGYPIGKETKEYISKTFNNSKNSQKAYEQASQYLEDLKVQYPDVNNDEKKINVCTDKSVERKSRTNKNGSDKYDMPKYICLKVKGKIETGFAVDGIRIIQDNGDIMNYTKCFTSQSLTMDEKLQLAKKHLDEIKHSCKCLID